MLATKNDVSIFLIQVVVKANEIYINKYRLGREKNNK